MATNRRDTRGAVWVSHSSISDFLSCPRSYYLRNIYRNPATRKKITVATPPLSLGQTVHAVLEGLAKLPVEDRFQTPLADSFQREWKKVAGKLGGFSSEEQERRYKERGLAMVARVAKNPGPLKNLAIRIPPTEKGFDLPYFWLSEEEGIILCGKIDWLEYLEASNSLHIIDFKTSRNEVGVDSLQLPIYYLLASNLQTRKVTRASYWYLNHNDRPTPVDLPSLEDTYQQVLGIALRIKLARQLNKFACPNGEEGCSHCQPYERILRGEGELVGEDNMNREVYVLPFKDSLLESSEQELEPF